eukprot:2727294-Alexandrium_andersonii.AAC.1
MDLSRHLLNGIAGAHKGSPSRAPTCPKQRPRAAATAARPATHTSTDVADVGSPSASVREDPQAPRAHPTWRARGSASSRR